MKILRILELSWLTCGIVGLCLALYNLLTVNAGSALLPLAFSCIAGIIYWVRRKQRIAFQKQQDQA
ncbi:MAG: hypothetical protein ACO3O0_07635 [Bacteroidia bacterium]